MEETPSFVVRDSKGVRGMEVAVGIFTLALAVLFVVLLAALLWSGEELEGLWFFLGLAYAGIGFMGVFLLCMTRRKLRVAGSVLYYTPAMGRTCAFYWYNIDGLRRTANGWKLRGMDGKNLARFRDVQENSALLVNYLRERSIGQLAKKK